jgi:hypothetical protein
MTLPAWLLAAGYLVAAGPRTDPGLNAYQRFQGGPPVSPFPAPPPEKVRQRAAEPAKRAAETTAALRAQEEANLLRRLAVCDRIKQIALEQGDPKLEDEAIRLEQKAEEVYRQRTAKKVALTAKPEEERK